MGLDFLIVKDKVTKKGIEIYPTFSVMSCKDLMVRGGNFYAIWDEENQNWTTNEFRAIEIIDSEVRKEYQRRMEKIEKPTNLAGPGEKYFNYFPSYLKDSENRYINKWHTFVKQDMVDNWHQLDDSIVFADDKLKRELYSSKQLSYSLSNMETPAYNELAGTLYSPEELQKIEWTIGAIFTGASKDIQKFLVITGDAGKGKSTMLHIIEMLFEDYCVPFEAKSITSNDNQFSLSAFKSNPLVALEHDGNLSKIVDNSRLNSLVSHETMLINEKYREPYPQRFDTFLIMASNSPVQITDAKSGLTRRILDVEPSGQLVSQRRYLQLMKQIKFELGGIASHCMQVFKEHEHEYDKYRPIRQISKTYAFYDYISYMSNDFMAMEYVSLDYAWQKYKKYVELSDFKYSLNRLIFKNELMEFFKEFYERKMIDGMYCRNVYSGFIDDRLTSKKEIEESDDIPDWLKLGVYEYGKLDRYLAEQPAQYATSAETPMYKWENVTTKLEDLKPTELHYVKVPQNFIVIDFDLTDGGEKSLVKNLEAASTWPQTYAELSKSGKGLHLHYIYDGDVEKLSSIYAQNIEIKVFKGNASLRRRLSECNNCSIATISGGLPLKEVKVVDKGVIKNEQGLRKLILRNLNKEIHPYTKPSVDFINTILDEAYNSGIIYDVNDMYPAIMTFAMNSTNNKESCMKVVRNMKFNSEVTDRVLDFETDTPILYFDVEVFPNLFVVCYKKEGENSPVVKMINPSADEVAALFDYKLVGFNNRRYDNHILYAWAFSGYNNEMLFKLSQGLIGKNSLNYSFMEAYNASYADVYDYSSNKQSLKKWEIDLDIYHLENNYPWDEPVDPSHWDEIATYCANDVVATEKVAEACKQDFMAREILAKLSGLTVNHTTRQHTTKIIFGDDKHPELVYTDLSQEFPGYEFVDGKSSYMGEDPSEGGYVYAEPGQYDDVALLDIESLHPHSIKELNVFGEYTPRFVDILDARLAIKHGDFEKAKKMLDGKLAEFLNNEEDAEKLSKALKIVINSVYGYTSATFENPFKDIRNKDNIVAKRGALFMITLKHEVQKRGYTVAHIKTDSIKIPNADEEIISFCKEFAKKYGYTFEHEATYKKMCLVNDAVYVALYSDDEVNGKKKGKWTATGTQFQVPYVFKTLFSHEPIEFADTCETKSVTSALYLDFNEDLGEDEHDYHFVGRVGKFTPVRGGCGGGLLMREKDGKYYAATGTKGYRWLESEYVKNHEDYVDLTYYRHLVDEAKDTIDKFGDFNEFVGG